MSSPYEADSVVLPDERAVVVATGGLAVAGYVAGEALVDDRAAVELAARLMDQPETAVDLSRPELGTLLADNLQSLIRNPKRYLQIFGDDGSAFEPFRNHPPETVLVETADGIRTRILDGIHRLSGYFVHHDAIRARYPDFQFTIHNLTDRYARPDGPAGGRAITMAEYLRLVVPPNVAQERIAPDRLAAILITSWEDLVGRRIASHFSALAAFSVLDAERLAPSAPVTTLPETGSIT